MAEVALTMTRLELFTDALNRHIDFCRRESVRGVAQQMIRAQLEYLINLESGRESDRSKLRHLTLGILAVREVEPIDETLAELLYQVNGEASEM